jgi:pilus assembly protein CpaB
MNVKKVAPLVIALVLGLVAAKMAFDFVQKRQDQTASDTKKVQIVIAKRPVDAGQVLTDDDLAMGDVSSEAVNDTVFKSTDQVVGRVTVVSIVQGQAVSTTLLAPRGSGPGLQATVPLGMRAVTVDINEITGVAGYLVPGCHVDVLQTLRDEKSGLPVAHTLAQNIKVTAVGQKHGPDGDGGGRSITLLVTPQQAELFELASSVGRPRFALRGSNDLSVTDTKEVTLAELIERKSARNDEFNTIAAVVQAPSTQPSATVQQVSATTRPSLNPDDDQWTVEIIRGSSESDVKFALHHGDEQFSGGPDSFEPK